jgi:hypothetical protein
MLARGTILYTRGGRVLVEDIEGEEFPVPHPTKGFSFVRCEDAQVIEGLRTILMLEDGRDLIVASDLLVFTQSGGLIAACHLQPGTMLAGPSPGKLEGLRNEAGSLYEIETLRGVPFVAQGISVMG